MPKKQVVDVLIIGGGPGGTPAALALASHGKRVLLVEGGQGLGGTCLFEGCIPSKVLWESARRLRELKQAARFGLRLPAGEIELDWATVLERKRTILQKRARGALHHTSQLPSLQVFLGAHARLLDARHAQVDAADGERFEVQYGQAILATGSLPNRPPIPGIDLPGVLTSEGLLELDRLPASLTVIGAGPIGIEMAQIFRAFGTQVSVLEMAPRILLPIEEELALQLQQYLTEIDGIKLELDARVGAIRQAAEGLAVDYVDAQSQEQTIQSEFVLVVTGRHPNVEGLGLEHTAVVYDQHGVSTDAQLQTAEPGVYAAGDVVGQPMFAHWASAQALALARHLLGQPVQFPTPASNTAVIFSTPELGMAGLGEVQAQAAGYDVSVARYSYTGDARAQVGGHPEGQLKVVYDTNSRKILGIHLLGEGAGDLLGEAALAVRAGLSLDVLAASIHPHPTLTEAFGTLARTVMAGNP